MQIEQMIEHLFVNSKHVQIVIDRFTTEWFVYLWVFDGLKGEHLYRTHMHSDIMTALSEFEEIIRDAYKESTKDS